MCHQYLPCHCCLGLNTLLAHPLGMSVKISLTYFCKLFKIFYSVIIPPLPLWPLFFQRCPENNTNEQLIRLKYICKHKKTYIIKKKDLFYCSICIHLNLGDHRVVLLWVVPVEVVGCSEETFSDATLTFKIIFWKYILIFHFGVLLRPQWNPAAGR